MYDIDAVNLIVNGLHHAKSLQEHQHVRRMLTILRAGQIDLADGSRNERHAVAGVGTRQFVTVEPDRNRETFAHGFQALRQTRQDDIVEFHARAEPVVDLMDVDRMSAQCFVGQEIDLLPTRLDDTARGGIQAFRKADAEWSLFDAGRRIPS